MTSSEFWIFEIFKCEIPKNSKFKASNNFGPSEISQNWCHVNQRGRKMVKFPNCGISTFKIPIKAAQVCTFTLEKFSVTKILHEIKGGKFKMARLVILAHLEALHFDLFMIFCTFWRLKISQIKKIHSPWNGKKALIGFVHSPSKISRKIMKNYEILTLCW